MIQEARAGIRLLALDVDDTLLPQGGVISRDNLSAINRARDAGVYVAIATGRGYIGAAPICKTLDIKGPVIVFGGAKIMDTRTGECLLNSQIPPDLVREALETAAELGIYAHIFEGDGIVCERAHPYSDAYIRGQNLPRRLDPHIRQKQWRHVPKVLAITEPEKTPVYISLFQERFKGRLKISGSRPGFIEINRLDAHKGNALMRLAEMMGLNREQVAAVGDNSLDLEMIRWAGLGAAVADAEPEALASADIIVPSCNQNGVAWLIERYILGRA